MRSPQKRKLISGMAVAPVERRADTARDAVQQGNAQLPFLLEFLLLLLVQQAVGHLRDLCLRQRVLVGDDDFAVDAEGGRHAGDEVKVGGVEVVGGGEKAVEVCRVLIG